MRQKVTDSQGDQYSSASNQFSPPTMTGRCDSGTRSPASPPHPHRPHQYGRSVGSGPRRVVVGLRQRRRAGADLGRAYRCIVGVTTVADRLYHLVLTSTTIEAAGASGFYFLASFPEAQSSRRIDLVRHMRSCSRKQGIAAVPPDVDKRHGVMGCAAALSTTAARLGRPVRARPAGRAQRAGSVRAGKRAGISQSATSAPP
jgi:hypothetical protein